MREGGKHVTQLKKGGGREGGRETGAREDPCVVGAPLREGRPPDGLERPSRRGDLASPQSCPSVPALSCSPSLSCLPSSQGIPAKVASSAQARLVATPTLRRAVVSATTVSRENPPQCKARGSSPTTG